MRLSYAIKIAVALTVMALSADQLPKVIRAVQIAHLYLIKQSPLSSWEQEALLQSKFLSFRPD